MSRLKADAHSASASACQKSPVRTFFDKLHPPSILILSKCCFAPKVVDVSRLLDGGLLYLRRAFSRCGLVTTRQSPVRTLGKGVASLGLLPLAKRKSAVKIKFLPPLCKRRWFGVSRTGRIVQRKLRQATIFGKDVTYSDAAIRFSLRQQYVFLRRKGDADSHDQ